MCTTEQHPGKFEGETCITHLMHAWAGNGFMDTTYPGCECGEDSKCQCTPVDTVMAPFTLDDVTEALRSYDVELCPECVKDFLAASTIRYFEDSQGFAYSELA